MVIPPNRDSIPDSGSYDTPSAPRCQAFLRKKRRSVSLRRESGEKQVFRQKGLAARCGALAALARLRTEQYFFHRTCRWKKSLDFLSPLRRRNSARLFRQADTGAVRSGGAAYAKRLRREKEAWNESVAPPHPPDAGLTCGWERKNGEMDVELPRLPGKRNAMRPF